jgi:hypothetical protein
MNVSLTLWKVGIPEQEVAEGTGYDAIDREPEFWQG